MAKALFSIWHSMGATQLGIVLIIAVICGAICHAMATGKRRSPELWAVLGFLFGLFAVILLAVLPSV
ncbi:MAG: hypothetical protein ACK456_04685 [Pseudanabaenaceae cyanobacterium]|jgi:hypothetical protein